MTPFSRLLLIVCSVLVLALATTAISSLHAAMSPGPSMETQAQNVATERRPGHLPLDVEGYPVAPSDLELEQVHIYVRHGERTPVGIRLADPPASLPEHWLFCHTARNFRAAVASAPLSIPGAPANATQYHSGTEESLRTLRVVERADGTAAPGECLLGELTDVGRQTTYDFGLALRRLYIDRLGFLPDTVSTNEEVYLRSTNVPRTIESLQQIVHGLYPDNKTAAGFVPHLRIRNSKDENLFGNTLACKQLENLQIAFARAAAIEWRDALATLDGRLSKYLGGKGLRLDGRPRASGILDTIKAANAHGIPVPAEFNDPKVMGLVEEAIVHEWFADKTEEVRRLGMGPLLSDLSRKLGAKAAKGASDPVKVLIHSAHDTSLAALCSTLDVFDEKWPPFSSAVTFELFRRREQHDPSRSVWQSALAPFQQLRPDPPSEHYVRMRYQNRNVALPTCAAEGKHYPGSPELCTLAAFRQRVHELTPIDFEAECTPRTAS